MMNLMAQARFRRRRESFGGEGAERLGWPFVLVRTSTGKNNEYVTRHRLGFQVNVFMIWIRESCGQQLGET